MTNIYRFPSPPPTLPAHSAPSHQQIMGHQSRSKDGVADPTKASKTLLSPGAKAEAGQDSVNSGKENGDCFANLCTFYLS